MYSNPESIFSRRRVQTTNTEDSMTQQHFAEECNMRSILEKALKRGQAPVMAGDPRYMDCTGDFNFRETMTMIAQAQQAFDELPSQLRARFANNAANLIDFLGDENNYDEALKLGLVVPRKEKTNVNDSTNTASFGGNQSSIAAPSSGAVKASDQQAT